LTKSVACQPPLVLAIRKVTDRIEAVLSWVPDSLLRTEAEGTQLHLASHVLDSASDRVLIYDGPRAVPCLGSEGKLCILPLIIPPDPGHYRIQIEPVVEMCFWGSARGYDSAWLDVTRQPDGPLSFHCPATGQSYVLDDGTPDFVIDGPLYGIADSERCVEIPWSLARYRGETRVLDVGYANAEPRYWRPRNSLKIRSLVGLDIVPTPQPGIAGVVGDVLMPPFAPGSFDLIFAISVLEHIGRDNSIYFDSDQPSQEFGDLESAAILVPLLRPGGRLLVTLPFGRLEDHGWFIQYDFRRAAALVEATGCDLALAEYYCFDATGWHGPVDPLTLSHVAYRPGFGAGAVVCLELTRRTGQPDRNAIRSYARSLRSVTVAAPASSLATAITGETARILKLSATWSKMHGESARMRPIMLFCETVNICNADCVFCPYSRQTRPYGFMKSDLFERVLDQYAQIGGGLLALTPMVGDALLDRFWMQRIRLLAEMRRWITPSVTTNLYALDKYSDQEIIEMMGVLRRIHISCYGIDDAECESLTRRRSFHRFLSHTRRLLNLRKACGVDCDVRVGFRLAIPRTREELASFLRDRIGQPLPFKSTATYANWGNSIRGTLPPGATWIPPRMNESPCAMLPLSVQVYWNGRVSACSCCDYDSSDQLYLGDITSQSLEEIFNSPKNQTVWQVHQAGELHQICRDCTFHVPLAALDAQHLIVQSPLDFIGG
jgi:O-antigen chain-terminating methyltransferase